MPESLPRSPLLMCRDDSALLVVDAQEKLLPLMLDSARLLWNIERLVEGAEVLGIPRLATEQYPQKLGSTVAPLRQRLSAIPDKLAFSCGGCPVLVEQLQQTAARKVLLTGLETHVCILQTSLDLLTAGYDVFIAVDAVGSRNALDHQTALRRLEGSGAVLTTTETTLFEWAEVAGTAEFKQISQIVQRPAPG